MKKILFTMSAVLLVMSLVSIQAAWADDYDYIQGGPEVGLQPGDGNTLFSAEELDDLLAPIALYPDPLIAQILPAATFVDQIDEAVRYLRQYGQTARVDDMPWDVSVKAVAHYPDVLFMMDQKYDWTVSLGQAYVNQTQDVMDAIQRLRAEAVAAGTLVSTPQQQVITEDDVVSIVPAQPEEIYVPQYDPLAVYEENPSPAYGFITFSIGLPIGAWLNRDCDWHRHRVYYHGWQGGGWISRARPHVQARNNVYVNNTYSVVKVNRQVLQHDTARYREEIRSNVQYRPEHVAQPTTVRPASQLPVGIQSGKPRQATTAARPAPRPAGVVQPTTTRPASQPHVAIQGGTPPPTTTVVRSVPHPTGTDVYRGREVKGEQPAMRTGYGGYGSGKDATMYRSRGQASQENMRQFSRPQPTPAPGVRSAPAQRPAATGVQQTIPQHVAPPASRGGGGQRQQR